MEARRRHLSGILAKRQRLDARVKIFEQPINKGGCHGLRIVFSSEVESMKEKSGPSWWTKTQCNRDTGTGNVCKLQWWKLRHWRGLVQWSTPAELLKKLGFQNGGAQQPHTHGIACQTKRGGNPYISSPIIKHFFVSLSAVVYAAEYVPNSRQRAQGALILKGATAERCMVMCPLGRSWYRGLWDKKTRERNKEPDL